MRTATIIIAVSVLMLLLVACSPEEQRVTGEAVPLTSPSTTVTEQGAAAVRDYEVRLTDDGFFPATFHAEPGETLRLVFLLDEPRFISIDGLGVAEHVQAGVVEAVAKEQGEYSLLCLDCDDAHEALIVIA
ncbi:hypothetical protein JXA12_00465 [Candidatus Woesearchaeota archaeon]|nr:hypothetical protein [Candidatus Woesearchaeota archaeon]